MHHTRDADGDVILYFSDPQRCPEGTCLQSSPVVSIRRSQSAVIDQGGDPVGRYVITTQHTDYDLQMPRAKAEHLARELKIPVPHR